MNSSTTTTRGPTETLCAFVLDGRYEHFPPAVVKEAKHHILDVFGAMLGGIDEPASKIATEFARQSGGTEEAGVIGAGFCSSVVNAAFVNGISGHALEIEAVGRAPGSDTLTLVAAALSLAEKYKLTGKQVIEYVVLAEEFQGWLGLAAPGGSGRGHCGLNLYAPPAIAAACGRVMGMDLTQTRMAVGLALSRASGYYRHTGTMAHTHESGLACRGGIEAAMLAASGMTADASLLEGKGGFVDLMCAWDRGNDLDIATANLGDPYYLVSPGLSVKKYGCCFLAHRPMDALMHLMAQHKLRESDVAAITVDVNALTARIMKCADPQDGDQAKFSMEHALAAVLVDGKVEMPYVLPFSDAGAVDPRYVRARQRVEMAVRNDLPPGLATGAAPPVTVRLKDGTTLTQTAVGLFRGSPENPLDDDELLARYRTCAAHTLSPAAVERTSEILLNLEQCSDLRELMRIGTFGR